MPTRTIRFNAKSGREIETIDFWFVSEDELRETIKAQKIINGARKTEIV